MTAIQTQIEQLH